LPLSAFKNEFVEWKGKINIYCELNTLLPEWINSPGRSKK